MQVTFRSPGLGPMTKPFVTYEIRKVAQLNFKAKSIVDTSVKTSAPYGDSMNPVVSISDLMSAIYLLYICTFVK